MRRSPIAHDERTDTLPLERQRGARARGENRTHFEQPDVAFHVREVELRATGERFEDGRAEVGFVFRERVRDAHVCVIASGYERKWAHLEEPLARERILNGRLDHEVWRVRNATDAERSQLIREGVVAMEPRYLFDHVDLRDRVGTP